MLVAMMDANLASGSWSWKPDEGLRKGVMVGSQIRWCGGITPDERSGGGAAAMCGILSGSVE